MADVEEGTSPLFSASLLRSTKHLNDICYNEKNI